MEKLKILTGSRIEGEREGQAEIRGAEKYGDGKHNIKTDRE